MNKQITAEKKLYCQKESKLLPKKIKSCKIENSAAENQKLTSRVNGISTKQVCLWCD